MYKKIREIPAGFDSPTALPRTEKESALWQKQNRTWWENHPMRYDWNDKIQHEEFSRGFFDEIDRRFFASAERYLPSTRLPFDQLIPFDSLPQLDVLEIGVGNGSHAALLAKHAKSFIGVDLTDYAVRATTARLKVFGLEGRVLQMDAEQLTLPDESVDLVWTWGVIHHSSNTRKILEQMRRVLRPGGKAFVMIYYRNLWEYYVRLGLMRSIQRGWSKSIHDRIQTGTDGGLARFYTIREWEQLCGDLFAVDETRIMGQKAGVVPIPGKLGLMAQELIPDGVTRFLTNTLRLGQFLVAEMTRR